jgi:hypothetical protein
MLHSDVLCGIIWLVIMAVVCHYGRTPVFALYKIDNLGVRLDCFDQSI